MPNTTLNILVEVQGTQAAEAKLVGVSSATKGVGTQAEATAKKTSGLRSQLGTLATGFAVYKGAQYIKGAVKETTDLAKATAGLQRITGMDAQTASGWVAIAKERGIQSKQLNMGFITLARQMSGAANGSKSAAAAFQALGLNAEALKQQTPQVQMGMLADSFKALPAGVDKAALAQKLFGRQAQSLLPLLNQGAKGLNEQVTTMGKATGMTGNSAKSAMNLVRSQRELHASMMSLQVAVGMALIPILTSLSAVIVPIASGFAKLMQGSTAFRVSVVALTAALTVWIAVSKLLALAGIEVEAGWIWVAIVPAAIIGIGVAFVMLYNKCAWFRNAVQAVMHGVVAAVNWVKNAAIGVFNWIKGHWPLLLGILTGPIGLAVGLIIKNWGKVKSTVVNVANTIKGALTGAFNAVAGAAKGAIDVILSGWNSLQFKIPSFKVGPVHFGGTTIGVPKIPLLAAGGVTTTAGTAIVGERGPELLSLPGGAQVSPLGGGVIHTHVYIGPREIAQAMSEYVAGQQAAR